MFDFMPAELPVRIPIQRLDEGIEIPTHAYAGDAGTDLRSTVDAALEPFERMAVPCGIAIALPEGYAGFVLPRSGLAAKHGVSIVNAPGLIDSGYRGELKVVLVNLDPREPFEIKRGDRIAQLVVMPVPPVTYAPVDALSETERGTGGFGSSGVRA